MHGVRAFLRCAIAGFDEELHRAASGAQQLDALRLEQRAGVRQAHRQQEHSCHGATQQRATQPSQHTVGSVHVMSNNKKATLAKLAWLVVAPKCLPNQYIFGGNCMLRTRL